jgi:hypothetical protein
VAWWWGGSNNTCEQSPELRIEFLAAVDEAMERMVRLRSTFAAPTREVRRDRREVGRGQGSVPIAISSINPGPDPPERPMVDHATLIACRALPPSA